MIHPLIVQKIEELSVLARDIDTNTDDTTDAATMLINILTAERLGVLHMITRVSMAIIRTEHENHKDGTHHGRPNGDYHVCDCRGRKQIENDTQSSVRRM